MDRQIEGSAPQSIACDVIFRNTANGTDFSISFGVLRDAHSSTESIQLDVDERIRAYDKAAKIIGEDNLSDYVIASCEPKKPSLSVQIQNAESRLFNQQRSDCQMNKEPRF